MGQFEGEWRYSKSSVRPCVKLARQIYGCSYIWRRRCIKKRNAPSDWSRIVAVAEPIHHLARRLPSIFSQAIISSTVRLPNAVMNCFGPSTVCGVFCFSATVLLAVRVAMGTLRAGNSIVAISPVRSMVLIAYDSFALWEPAAIANQVFEDQLQKSGYRHQP